MCEYVQVFLKQFSKFLVILNLTLSNYTEFFPQVIQINANIIYIKMLEKVVGVSCVKILKSENPK